MARGIYIEFEVVDNTGKAFDDLDAAFLALWIRGCRADYVDERHYPEVIDLGGEGG